MAEYIEREAFLDYMKGTSRYFNVKFDIENFPAADVAPVVRCKACVHWEGDPDTYSDDNGVKGFCMKSFERANEDDFCSHGERKDGGAEHATD